MLYCNTLFDLARVTSSWLTLAPQRNWMQSVAEPSRKLAKCSDQAFQMLMEKMKRIEQDGEPKSSILGVEILLRLVCSELFRWDTVGRTVQ
jgi:hypothetical protein